MNTLELFLSCSTLLSLLVLCAFVLTRKVFSILPFFAIYSFVLLVDTVVVWLIYEYFGFNSVTAYYSFWVSILLNAVARSLAIAEMCRYGLRAYRGIWALVWRVLTILSILLISRTIFDARGVPNRVALYGTTVDRDLALASIVILLVLLLFRNYYGITLEPLQRGIALGICFICIVDVIGNTVLRNIFTSYLLSFFLANQETVRSALNPIFQRVSDLWGIAHLFSFMFTIGIWCYALRKPLPVRQASPTLLPSNVYRDLSPAINMRLASFNSRMVELLKP
jgi:hypothetical protein